jgi:hypothetical protein
MKVTTTKWNHLIYLVGELLMLCYYVGLCMILILVQAGVHVKFIALTKGKECCHNLYLDL